MWSASALTFTLSLTGEELRWSLSAPHRHTIAFATIGTLSSRSLSRIAGFSLLISSGTLLATIGAGGEVLAGALFYLVASTLGVSAL